MRVCINGKDREIPEIPPGASLDRLIQHLSMKSDRIAVERNGTIVPRSAWPQTALEEGDKLEIVKFVGGGCKSAIPSSVKKTAKLY